MVAWSKMEKKKQKKNYKLTQLIKKDAVILAVVTRHTDLEIALFPIVKRNSTVVEKKSLLSVLIPAEDPHL